MIAMKPDMTPPRIPWGTMGIIAAVVIWLVMHDRQVRAETLLKQRDDSLVVVTNALKNVDRLRLEADARAQIAYARLQDSIDVRQLRRDSLNAVLDVARATFRGTLSKVQVPIFDNLVSNERQVKETSDSIIGDLRAQRDSALAMYHRADAAAASFKALSDKWETQATAWRKQRTHTGFGCTGGYGLNTAGAGLGITCGIQFKL